MRLIIVLTIAVAVAILPIVPTNAGRIGELMESVRLTATSGVATATASATIAPSPTLTAAPPMEAQVSMGDCDTPPPWNDYTTAERCHTHYPPPFAQGNAIEGCQLAGEYSYMLCYGYWPDFDAPDPPQFPDPPVQPTSVGYPAPYP